MTNIFRYSRQTCELSNYYEYERTQARYCPTTEITPQNRGITPVHYKNIDVLVLQILSDVSRYTLSVMEDGYSNRSAWNEYANFQ